MAERGVDAQMEKVKALHGTVVVQHPHTGQILALAIAPRFTPNDQRHMEASVLQNLPLSDVYERGWTFKLLAYSAALAEAALNPAGPLPGERGALTLAGAQGHGAD